MPPRLTRGINRTAIIVPLLVAFFLVVLNLSSGTFWSLYASLMGEPTSEITTVPTYSSSDGILQITQAEPNEPPDDRDPWLGEEAWIAGVQAGQEYIARSPEPQNVQVLKGMTTAEIWAYMIHISGALGVGCQYCHTINNFAADPYPEKISARLMLLLVRDVNSQFITEAPTWGGRYVQCATCHQGQPINMLAFSSRNDYSPVATDTGEQLQTWQIDFYAVAPSEEYVVQHPNTGTMLAMVNWMHANWNRYVLPRPGQVTPDALPLNNRQDYVVLDETVYSVPNCYTCHVGNRIPRAALTRWDLARMQDEGWTVLPDMLRTTEVDPETGRMPGE